ncbi:hypothetical protein FQZ97_568290 [compost metagenome]
MIEDEKSNQLAAYGQENPAGPFEALHKRLRQKKICSKCPFHRDGRAGLSPEAVRHVLSELLPVDFGSYDCQEPCDQHAGDEVLEAPICAGAVAYLLKRRCPTLAMRLAFETGVASPEDWESIKVEVID